MPRSPAAPFAMAGAFMLAASPALAHHAMDGEVPQTVWQGLAAGLAHPVLGLDHLAFLLAAGVLLAARRAAALPALIGATLLGAALQLGGIAPGPVEALVALSVLLAGLVLLRPPGGMAALLLPAGFAVAGLAHGAAYAESVTGAPLPATLAYLFALSGMQAALALAGAPLLRGLRRLVAAPRLVAGGAVSAVGFVALAQALAG